MFSIGIPLEQRFSTRRYTTTYAGRDQFEPSGLTHYDLLAHAEAGIIYAYIDLERFHGTCVLTVSSFGFVEVES